MPSESQIPTASQAASGRFATRLALFYGAMFGLLGAYLPFFPVWLKAVGIEASWIGIITAVPAVTRFTVLPLVTSLAERRQSLRNAITVLAFITALGLTVVGTQHQAPLVFVAFAATCRRSARLVIKGNTVKRVTAGTAVMIPIQDASIPTAFSHTGKNGK